MIDGQNLHFELGFLLNSIEFEICGWTQALTVPSAFSSYHVHNYKNEEIKQVPVAAKIKWVWRKINNCCIVGTS